MQRDIIPFPPVERTAEFKVYGKRQTGDLIVYPRVGRTVWEMNKLLLPPAKFETMIKNPDSSDYNGIFNNEFED